MKEPCAGIAISEFRALLKFTLNLRKIVEGLF